MNQKKSYSELIKLPTFEERFNYLKLEGSVGEDTFGYDRYLNQMLYTSKEWRNLRNDIIVRDEGCDMALNDYEIPNLITIHHINPITKYDILKENPMVFDPENLVCCSIKTHKAIHYNTDDYRPFEMVDRQPNDTCPWRK